MSEIIEHAAGGIKGQENFRYWMWNGFIISETSKNRRRVTGVDISHDMLTVAEQRANALSVPVTFIEQPMQQLDGFSDFDVAVIAIDSLNYVIEREEVIQTFRNIYDSLAVGGVLIIRCSFNF